MSSTEISQRYLDGVKSHDLLWQLTWDDWLAIEPPYADGKFTTQDVTKRYQRNDHVGYAELHNEKIAYLWLWAYKSGYFE